MNATYSSPPRSCHLGCTLLILAWPLLLGCPIEHRDETEPLEETEEKEEIVVPYDARLRLVALQVDPEEGMPQPVDPAGIVEIPRGGSLYLETWQRLDDYRVRLVDSNDRLVPFSLEAGPVALRSSGNAEPGGTWVRLTPAGELQQGRDYALRLEPELGDRITDYHGYEYEDLSISIRSQEEDTSRCSETDEAGSKDSSEEP